MTALIDTLYRQLTEKLLADDETQPAWLLIDAMHVDVRQCLPAEVPDAAIHVVPLAHDRIEGARYPHLVAIGSHDVERIRASLAYALKEQAEPSHEQTRGFAIGGWLRSAAAPAKLARHLALCMCRYFPGQGRPYVRWADRRVLEWMWPAMDDTARAALLGPVQTWWTLDRCNTLVEYRAVTPTPDAFWRLTDAGWQHARDCEPVQALLRSWRLISPRLPEDYRAQAAQAVRGARSLGLTELTDLVTLGLYVIQVHPNLCAHPHLQARVQSAKAQGRPLIETLAEIPDPDGWVQMRDELASTGHPATASHRELHHG